MRGQAGSNSTSRRVAPRAALVVAGAIVGLVGVVVAVFECGARRRPASVVAAPGHEVSFQRTPSQRAPSPTERSAVPRPVLPATGSANEAPSDAARAERPSARAETKLVLTQIKVQKYVDEAYPAWLRAHPGMECPHKLIELNEYMDDKDANDAWGRPLRMLCGAALPGGEKGIKVVSRGRDGETSEDDIKFGP